MAGSHLRYPDSDLLIYYMIQISVEVLQIDICMLRNSQTWSYSLL